jgi:hypothetical protein
MARSCAFCPNPADSREHIWPDWLRRREDIREALPHVFAEQREASAPVITRAYRDQPYKMKARFTCGECNNGWMSRLEQDAEQILSVMLAGRARAMHSSQRARLAAWAFKTAVVFDYPAPHARVIPRESAQALRDHGHPPHGTKIWMASYDTTNVGICCVSALEVALEGQDYDPNDRNVYIRTFTIGPVVFQVYGTTNPRLTKINVRWPFPNVHQLWPHGGQFTWRPQPAMTDGDVVMFADYILLAFRDNTSAVSF